MQAEVEETKEWFASRNDGGNAPQTHASLQQELQEKTHQIELLQEQLRESTARMEDLEEWRQVSEEEAEVRAAQVDILKTEIARLMSEEKGSDDDKHLLSKLEAHVSVIMTEHPPSPRSASRGRSMSAKSPEGEGEARGLVDELTKKNADLQNKIRVVETELHRRNEAFDLQCGLLDATRDEKNAWQDATQVSNEFNVKLNARINELQEQLKLRVSESSKVKSLTDDLKAKEDQIFVLTEMLGTFSDRN